MSDLGEHVAEIRWLRDQIARLQEELNTLNKDLLAVIQEILEAEEGES